MSLRDVRRTIQDRKIKFVDFRFTDLLGGWRHISYAIEAFDEDMFVHGIGFDGSSVRGFQGIERSDMLLRPDPDSGFIDPFYEEPTLVFICNVKDPVDLSLYSRDPRNIVEKATRFLETSALADTCYVGPEAEFYIFDDVRFDQTVNEAFYYVDSGIGAWNVGRVEKPNLGHKPGLKQGYFRMPPTDPYQDVRSQMLTNLRDCGVDAELHHQEVGSGGQCEIGIKYTTISQMADSMMKFKYIVKNTANRHGRTATFMPKPLFGDNGSGMHCHMSLWRKGKNLFYDPDGYAGLSETGVFFIGGILKHAASLCAFTCPTANSYRRLVPGFEAPNKLVYSRSNRSAAVRIPMYSAAPGAKRIEFRCPDPSANPYLAFSAIMMAGVDGITNRIVPPDPVDQDLYELPEAELRKIGDTPPTLKAALNALEEDHEYLLRGDVFTHDVIDTWIRYKRANELAYMDQRPHPAEFALYYDC